MCGITGALWFEPSGAVAASTLDAMTDALVHRGPDDRGVFLQPLQHDVTGITPGVGLGFRRLSIIDLDGGHQPMTNEDG
ncbi:MAG: asparagine synthetase B, partial [Pirellulaceae bacterium]|nr:asparagine synthetase B [Pirellulaceae bacterium]